MEIQKNLKILSIQYQLSTLIGQDLDLYKMLDIFVPKMVKIINCVGGYVWLCDQSTQLFEKKYFYPNEIINLNSTLEKTLEKLYQGGLKNLKTPYIFLGKEKDTYSYVFPIGEIGIILLQSKMIELPIELLQALCPVFKSLSMACIACIHYMQVESRYQNVFENSPVSLLEGDYSELRNYLKVCKEKTPNLRDFFEKDFSEIKKCLKMIKIKSVNKATLHLFRVRDLKELLSSTDTFYVFNDQTKASLINRFIAISEDIKTYQFEIKLFSSMSQTIDALGKYTVLPGCEDYSEVLFSLTDITEMKRAQNALAYTASHDVLTGLANRSLYQETLINAVKHANKIHLLVGLIYIDVDHFKIINDTYGHTVGDLLLIEISNRIRRAVRSDDLVARLGGDEFAIVLNGLHSELEAEKVVTVLRSTIAEPYVISNHVLKVTVSIGVTFYPDDATEILALNRNADIALYNAKYAGRNNFKYYQERLNKESR